MSYKSSSARNAAKEDLTGTIKRIKAAQKKSVSTDIREYVVAAAIFLAHATLENYISDVFVGIARAMRSSTSNGTKLPDMVLSHLFMEKLNKSKIYGAAIGSSAEHEMLKSVFDSLKGHAGALLDSQKPLPEFTGKDLYTNYKYPSEKNLKRIFHRIGINDIFAELNIVLRRDSKSLLESIGSLRTQLAHAGQLTGISAPDVITRIKDTEKFIGAMDRILYRSISSRYSQNCWHANLT